MSYIVPPEFRVEIPRSYRPEVISITFGDVGGCTIDFKMRRWAPGYGASFGRREGPYKGRGWEQKMVDEACALLRGLQKEINERKEKR